VSAGVKNIRDQYSRIACFE